MRAAVRKILPFSSVDGPGNRAAIFLQGCNFDCAYCHNPETIGTCDGCGACVASCPAGALSAGRDGTVAWNEARCRDCGACERGCPRSASPKTISMTPGEALDRVMRYRAFIRGVTASGGEASLRADWVEELFRLAKGYGFDTALDTNGSLALETRPGLLEVCDGVLLDVKSADPAEHRRLTGADNAAVLGNLRFLAEAGKLWEVRTVVVMGMMDAARTVSAVADALARSALASPPVYRLIRYRPVGVRPGRVADGEPTDAFMTDLARIARERGVRDVVVT